MTVDMIVRSRTKQRRDFCMCVSAFAFFAFVFLMAKRAPEPDRGLYWEFSGLSPFFESPGALISLIVFVVAAVTALGFHIFEKHSTVTSEIDVEGDEL
jgi:hypothetical protein